MTPPLSRVHRRAVTPLLPSTDEAQTIPDAPAANTTAASSSSPATPTLKVDAAPEPLAGAARDEPELSPTDVADRTIAYADGEDTDDDGFRDNPAKAVHSEAHAATPPAQAMTIKQFWRCLKETLTPQVTMNYVEAYCTEHRAATVEEIISHIERMRKRDQRIQPGTIARMRRMLANARAGVDPLGPPPPPPDPPWLSEAGW
jgi:hypothetical protein